MSPTGDFLLECFDIFISFNLFPAILKILPNMLALCLMLSCAYYAKNYASIIGLGRAYMLLCVSMLGVDVCVCVCVCACVHMCVLC